MDYIFQDIIAIVIGAAIVYLTIPVIVRVSEAKNLYDVPNDRKLNQNVVPNLGGIALFAGISISTIISLRNLPYPDFRYILAGMILLFFIGIKDDILTISPRKKFIIQFISALILILAGNIRFTNLHGVFGIYEINKIFSFIFSALAIVAVINAFNLIDGIDGLASSIGILVCLFFGVNFLLMHHFAYAILCFSIVGSLGSFFIFNVFGKKNKIYMGDTGSLILGLLVAVFVIKFNEFNLSEDVNSFHFSPAYSMAIISIPLLDMFRVFIIRIFNKLSPFSPDMRHIHHKLIRLGFSHINATLILITVNLFLMCAVWLSQKLNPHIQLAIIILAFATFAYLPDLLYKMREQKKLKTLETYTENELATFKTASKLNVWNLSIKSDGYKRKKELHLTSNDKKPVESVF